MKFQVLNRKAHYWASIIIALPLGLIIVTGILLQYKKQLTWVQPAERRGTAGEPMLALPRVLEICQGVPEAGVRSWSDISRVDVRPSKGMMKVSTKNHYEVQIENRTGEVLQVAYRRSDLIEALHDGSWFSDHVKYWVFVPTAFILLLLWLTGLYLFVRPFLARAKRQPSPALTNLPAPKPLVASTT